VPRNNTSQTDSSSRNRSRGPSRSTTPRDRPDAAAERSESSADTSTSETAPNSPTYDEIAEAAYHRYLSRGGVDGQDFDDWLEAERELRERRTQ